MFTMHHATKEIHMSSSFDETLLNFFDNEEIRWYYWLLPKNECLFLELKEIFPYHQILLATAKKWISFFRVKKKSSPITKA